MQVARPWSPPVGPLGRLSSASAERAARARALQPYGDQLASALAAPPAANMVASLTRGTTVSVIAEVKRSSPSRGAINPGIEAAAQAKAYAVGGATACSVLTEPLEFGGALDDLRDAAALDALPCIRKDFIVDAVQLVEARRAGAASALLIARALPPDLLTELVFVARLVGVEPLVEVRTDKELRDALDAGALLIGVNNRDLETLEIDEAVSARLLPQIPVTHCAIYESGVRSRADVLRAASYGADAVLVGSVLSAAADPAGAVRALCGVDKLRRVA